MNIADYVPDTLRDAGAFLKRELAPFPVRLNVVLRCMLTSAIVIVLSMTLEVPELALSRLVVLSLAVFEEFGPSANLTEIRDRLIGIFLGVWVANFVQVSIWRETESDVLRQKLATLLRAIAAQLCAPQAGVDQRDELSSVQRQLQAWAVLSECEATLSRVALEPGWQEGEQEQLTVHAQTVLAQGREIMLAGDALRKTVVAQAGSMSISSRRERTCRSPRWRRWIASIFRRTVFSGRPRRMNRPRG